MFIEISESQAEAIVEYFESEFLSYIQDQYNGVENIMWVADQLNFYQSVKNALKQENDKKTLDIIQNVCYNNITVKECDNTTTTETQEKCGAYHEEDYYGGHGGVCWGTKEKDPCDCNGDVKHCTHYPEKRG